MTSRIHYRGAIVLAGLLLSAGCTTSDAIGTGASETLAPPFGEEGRRQAIASDSTAWERYYPAEFVEMQREQHPSGRVRVAVPPNLVGEIPLGRRYNPVPATGKDGLQPVLDDQGAVIGYWDVVIGPVTIGQFEDSAWDLEDARSAVPQNPTPKEIADLVNQLALDG